VITDPIVVGIVAGLVLGKVLGIFGSTFLLARFTRAELDRDITWTDLLGVSLLAGIGFTVSLLIGELAFEGGAADDNVKAAVLTGSLIAALLASIVLIRRNKAYRRIAVKERVDSNRDGVPDVFQHRDG